MVNGKLYLTKARARQIIEELGLLEKALAKRLNLPNRDCTLSDWEEYARIVELIVAYEKILPYAK